MCRPTGTPPFQMKTRQDDAVCRLRRMILQGELPPGQHLAEMPLSSEFGLSRAPVKRALTTLDEEGLVRRLDTGGYVVRDFTLQEVTDAVELRGVLEGLAARRVAERGASRGLLRELNLCPDHGDALFATGSLTPGDDRRYAQMNARFHRLIVDAAGDMPLNRALALNDRIPFASTEAAAAGKERITLKGVFDVLKYAHGQHHAVVRALDKGEGARVEALMREHAMPAKEHMQLIMAQRGG